MQMNYFKKAALLVGITTALVSAQAMSSNVLNAEASEYRGNNSCVIAAARPTTQVKFHINLNPSDAPPVVSPFSPTNSASFNFVTSLVIYDSLGVANTLEMYYIKQSEVNTWGVIPYVNGASLGSGKLVFTSNGTLAQATGLTNLNWTPSSGATSPQAFSIDMTCSTQYGNMYRVVEAPWQDGQSAEPSFRAKLNLS